MSLQNYECINCGATVLGNRTQWQSHVDKCEHADCKNKASVAKPVKKVKDLGLVDLEIEPDHEPEVKE